MRLCQGEFYYIVASTVLELCWLFATGCLRLFTCWVGYGGRLPSHGEICSFPLPSNIWYLALGALCCWLGPDSPKGVILKITGCVDRENYRPFFCQLEITKVYSHYIWTCLCYAEDNCIVLQCLKSMIITTLNF